MRIEYTESEIQGNKLTPGVYDFIINDVIPVYTTDYAGNEVTRLNFKLECIAGDINVLSTQINYPITVVSLNEVHKRIGKNILKSIAMAIFPDNWKDKLNPLDTEELIAKRFSAEVTYKNDKYIQFNKIRPTTLAGLTPDTNSEVPF